MEQNLATRVPLATQSNRSYMASSRRDQGVNLSRKDAIQLQRRQARVQLVDRVFDLLMAAVPWAGAIGLAYFAIYRPTTVLAGRYTFAQIGYGVFGDIRVSEAVAWLFGVAGVAYGARSEHLRRNTLQHLHQPRKELELRIDPHRSSSMLTPRGTTRPEDK